MFYSIGLQAIILHQMRLVVVIVIPFYRSHIITNTKEDNTKILQIIQHDKRIYYWFDFGLLNVLNPRTDCQFLPDEGRIDNLGNIIYFR